MKVLYIGEFINGSTSKYRAEQLEEILKPDIFHVIPTDIAVSSTFRLFRTLGWRYKSGPLISNISKFIKERIPNKLKYDLIWVDKADMMSFKLIKFIRGKTDILVHFTPDNAFFSNKSHLFNKSIACFDYCITTKSFELELYKKKGAKEVLFCTQGYNPLIHQIDSNEKGKEGVVFIGLHEPYREKIIEAILKSNIVVKLGGIGWDKFVIKHKKNPNLKFCGKRILAEEYASLIRSAQIGLGLVSKRFPELHTTRTFEIPACGTVLVTEKNLETSKFFMDDEVCFFSSEDHIPNIISDLIADSERLEKTAKAGYLKVKQGGFDYRSIIKGILLEIGVYKE